MVIDTTDDQFTYQDMSSIKLPTCKMGLKLELNTTEQVRQKRVKERSGISSSKEVL